MDFLHFLNGQPFEWDETKAEENLAKHSISFETACEVFFDPLARVGNTSGEDEPREALIGLPHDSFRLLFVVHIERHGKTIRIISARKATSHERRLYEEC